MDTVTSDLTGRNDPTASRQVIGWWCLVDAGDVWEWGRALIIDVYHHPFAVRLGMPVANLQHAANQ
jgi:hypothetical protein